MRQLRSDRRRRRTPGVGVAALALALGGCGLFGDGPDLEAVPVPSPSAADAVVGGLGEFYDQELSWRRCRDTLRCATLTVPLDYADPDGETIDLSVLKVPATDDDQRIGPLVVNPGGPGASGVSYAASAGSFFGPELLAAFDIVGFDPRGVGESTPVDCLDDAALDEFVAADPSPDDPAEAARLDSLMAGLGAGCLERSGDLARHLSTEEAARDIDVLRAALGAPSLTFFGASYGTFLGATYADLFPERVGRMVLDGAVDPSLDSVSTSLAQAGGFEGELRAYVSACFDDDECFLGADEDAALARIRGLLDALDEQPIPGDGERDLTEGWATLGIWAPLYSPANWPLLDAGLAGALAGNGRVLLALADQYVDRGEEGYEDNSLEALFAVNCLDRDDAIGPRRAERLVEEFEEVSPTFGRGFAYGLTSCRQWPIHTGKGARELTADGAAPIMVVGTTRDPATPGEWARSLADQLESGVLVMRDGDGHTGYLSDNECVDQAVEAYLVSGVVPEQDVEC